MCDFIFAKEVREICLRGKPTKMNGGGERNARTRITRDRGDYVHLFFL
jgi:hypothetical protein